MDVVHNVPVPVEVPVAVPVAVPEPHAVSVEKEVPVYIDRPVIETVEKIIEPPPQPVPVMVKTIHDKTVVTEDPTSIHHVELSKPSSPVRGAAPVRSAVPAPSTSSGFKWWWLLPLLCCLPLCCLPCLFCCPKKKYKMSNVPRAPRPTGVDQKDLVSKEPVQYVQERVPVKKRRTVVRRVEEPESDIEIEIEKEIEKTAVVEETHVVRKEVPVK